MKKILYGILIVILILTGIVLFNTFTLKSMQKEVALVEQIAVDDAAIDRLADAVRFKTISYEDTSLVDYNTFLQLRAHIQSSFPFVDSLLELEIINQYSMLYHWKGKDPKLQPGILLAHLDVVPVENPDKWGIDPFAGEIEDGFLIGRGTLDDKLSVMGILEAVEMLLKEGFKPNRSWYFAFGHDEELTGQEGGVQLTKHLLAKGVKAEFILDEGLVVTKGMVPGIEKPVALIGLSEKGYLSIELSVAMQGGHSSMPEKETAISVLNHALYQLDQNPFEPVISEPVSKFLDYVGPEAPFTLKMAFANLWLFKPMVISTYQKTGPGAALVSSTIAPTIVDAGIKENVIPSQALAVVNLRVLPGLSVEEILSHFSTVIADERVQLKVLGNPKLAAPVASVDSEAYLAIEQSILQVFPEALVAPSLVLATTDSRHYTEVSDSIYKFLPVVLNSDDISGIHGCNEKISLENYQQCIRFYYQLIQNAAQ